MEFNKNAGQDLLDVFCSVTGVSASHPAIAKVDYGETADFADQNLYPLAFLELPFQIQEDKQTEEYSIALNVLDRFDVENQRILTLSKCKQILSQIKEKLKERFVSVSDGSYLTYDETGSDQAVGIRMEFTATVTKMPIKCNDIFS
ncbi:hypothetical protein [Xanthocytophaga agilis]|uniref:Uncharacterized protein n=1 Tax=Xanthocytophaga agilis TaxID=3048010 RepID=A0AAE3R3G5_9BACT|nr:hypothetical protein [Xanthocytophaga agilis]MDJ1500664.1 hypothetical protein [Xanthocytophaga agilis]